MKKNDLTSETPEQARKRLHIALAAEVRAYQDQGLPNEVIGLRVYASLVDARLQIESYQRTIRHLSAQLGQEISEIAKTH